MKNQNYWILAISALAITHSVFAKEGGAGTHGGDVRAIQKAQLVRDFKTLRDDASRFIDQVQLEDISDPEVRALLASLIDRGLKEDIRRSPYKIANQCRDRFGNSHDAATTIGKLGAEICFDLEQMSRESITRSELIGLTIHEHAHHFGYGDNDVTHRLIDEVARLSGFAFSVPSDYVIYSDDEGGVNVYRDSLSPNVFWYTPKLNVEIRSTQRDALTGIENVLLVVTSKFPEKAYTKLTEQLRGVQPTFKIIPATEITLGFQNLGLETTIDTKIMSETNKADQPFLVRLALTYPQARQFTELAKSSQGIGAEVRFSYRSTSISKSYQTEITCASVLQELNKSERFVPMWTVAEIRNGLRNILLSFVSTGSPTQINQNVNEALPNTLNTCFEQNQNRNFAVARNTGKEVAYFYSYQLADEGRLFVTETRIFAH
jgi:hypothetical protein